MMELCTPLVEKGGCDTVFIMPNLTPKIGSVSQAIEYHEKLQRLAPNVKFLMSLYLHNGLTEEEIEKAAKSGVVYGVSISLQLHGYYSTKLFLGQVLPCRCKSPQIGLR